MPLLAVAKAPDLELLWGTVGVGADDVHLETGEHRCVGFDREDRLSVQEQHTHPARSVVDPLRVEDVTGTDPQPAEASLEPGVRRAQGGVPRKGQLTVRGEDAQPVVSTRRGRREQERGLRQVGPRGERLHARVVESFAVDHDGHRVAPARVFPKDVHLGEATAAGGGRPPTRLALQPVHDRQAGVVPRRGQPVESERGFTTPRCHLTCPRGSGFTVWSMRAGQAASAAGVSVKALRYYERQDLVRPARAHNGYREYTGADVRAVAEVRALMALGLSAREAEPFVVCLRAGHEVGDDCAESIAAYQAKIDQVDAMITQLSGARDALAQRMVAAARRGFDHPPTTQTTTVEQPMTLPQPAPLPDGLIAPVDDGAAAHLPGRMLPAVSLPGTDGKPVALNEVTTGRWVLFCYPLTGEPGVDVPRGWDEIPGARGCSQEACSFRDQLGALHEAGAEQVLAVSSDASAYQRELADRLHLPYPLLSDPTLMLAEALGLPTFTAQVTPRRDGGGQRLYKRLTLVLAGTRIEHVFYPVFPPDAHATQVLDWLREHQAPPPRRGGLAAGHQAAEQRRSFTK